MSCNNCGHNSHCGVPLYETSKVDDTGEEYQYEVCRHCRCDDCSE